MKRILICAGIVLLVVFTVGAIKPKRKAFGYGVYEGGPPYFESYETRVATPVPEPACFAICGTITLLILIIKRRYKKP